MIPLQFKVIPCILTLTHPNNKDGKVTHGMTVILFQAYYEVKLVEELPVDFGEDHQETDPHILRIGWSLDNTSFQLGKIISVIYKGIVSATMFAQCTMSS